MAGHVQPAIRRRRLARSRHCPARQWSHHQSFRLQRLGFGPEECRPLCQLRFAGRLHVQRAAGAARRGLLFGFPSQERFHLLGKFDDCRCDQHSLAGHRLLRRLSHQHHPVPQPGGVQHLHAGRWPALASYLSSFKQRSRVHREWHLSDKDIFRPLLQHVCQQLTG